MKTNDKNILIKVLGFFELGKVTNMNIASRNGTLLVASGDWNSGSEFVGSIYDNQLSPSEFNDNKDEIL